MMIRTPLLCLVLGLTLLGALAATAEQPITTDSRIKTLVYNPNEVFALTTHYGYQSNIEFGPKESIDMISVGDRVAWQISPAGRRLFIRAQEENARTNMTVVTNLRAYQFDLRSSAADAVFGSDELTYVVRFFYPEEGGVPPSVASRTSAPIPIAAAPIMPPSPQQIQAAAPVYTGTIPTPVQPQAVMAPLPAPVAIAAPAPAMTYQPQVIQQPVAQMAPAPMMIQPQVIQPQAIRPQVMAAAPAPAPMPAPAPPPVYNYRYTYSGASGAAPVKIFDDGRNTYFKFAGAAAPQVSVINARGEMLSMPTHVTSDGLIAVNAIAPRFSIIQGSEQVVVYNEANGVL